MVPQPDLHARPRPRPQRAQLLTSIGILIALALAGCTKEAPPPPPDPVRVVTTVYAIGDIVRQVGGDRVNVEWWVESGQSLDALSETPQRRQQCRSADLIVTRGLPDPWTYRGNSNAFEVRHVLRVDTLPSARDADPTTYLWLDPRIAIEIAQEVADRL